MQKIYLIGGAICVFGALLSNSTGQGIGTTLFLTFIGAVLIVVGISGGKP